MEPLQVQSPLPENTPIDYKTCPTCKGEWASLMEDGLCYDCSKKKKWQEKDDQKLKDLTIKFIGLKGYEQYTFEKFKRMEGTEEAFDACIKFDPAKDNLYIHGSCGNGKTHLAIATWRKFFGFKTWMENYSHGAVYRQPDIMRLFRKIEADEEFELLEEFEKCKCLVIDDLGVGKNTEFANQILYEIIERRGNALQNGLIITSNLSLDEFAQKAGDDRLPSRIMGLCKRVKITSTRDMRCEK